MRRAFFRAETARATQKTQGEGKRLDFGLRKRDLIVRIGAKEVTFTPEMHGRGDEVRLAGGTGEGIVRKSEVNSAEGGAGARRVDGWELALMGKERLVGE